jgi:hypothetical protein
MKAKSYKKSKKSSKVSKRKSLSTVVSKERAKAYRAVGEYIVHFEMMLQTIRLFLKECAAIKANLDNDRVMDILLHDSTASSLLSYFKAFVYELFPEQMKEKGISDYLKQVFSEIENAYQKRNDIAHAAYKYGFYKDNEASDEINVVVVAARFKVYKDGLQDIYHKEKQGVIDFTELRNASIKLIELNDKIDLMIVQIGSTVNKLADQRSYGEIPKGRKKRQLKSKINLRDKDITTFD